MNLTGVPTCTHTGLLASPPDKRQQAVLGRLPLPAAPGGLQRVASEGMLQSAKSVAGPSSLQEQQQRQTDVCDGEVLGPDGWPAAHAFTTVSRVYSYRTVVLNWRDPRISGMLRPIIQARALRLALVAGVGIVGAGDQFCGACGTHNACCYCELQSVASAPHLTDTVDVMQGNERLLKLYESGLPAWAVYAPQYGELGGWKSSSSWRACGHSAAGWLADICDVCPTSAPPLLASAQPGPTSHCRPVLPPLAAHADLAAVLRLLSLLIRHWL